MAGALFEVRTEHKADAGQARPALCKGIHPGFFQGRRTDAPCVEGDQKRQNDQQSKQDQDREAAFSLFGSCAAALRLRSGQRQWAH